MSPHTDTSDAALLHTDFPTLPPPRRGKVRDIYDFGQTLLIVATDRISVFDVVLPTGIPGKGKILTQLSCFWFERTQGLVRKSSGGCRPTALSRGMPGILRRVGRSQHARAEG